MESAFREFISANNLLNNTSKVLAAVSGGVDSIVLAELFQNTSTDFSIAHCNFQLRGQDSEADEIFVRELSEMYRVPFFFRKFETKQYAASHKISVQMAARDLRYAWFKDLLKEHNLDRIATAHHADDNVETFFLNLVRGTGIRGLTGIEPKRDELIRPLLFAKKKELIEYARQKNLAFREDKSNKDTKYSRNLIRHEILPQLESLNPGFVDTMIETMDKLKAAKEPYENYLNKLKAELLEGNTTIKLNIQKLRKVSPLKHYLFELLTTFGFTKSDVDDIIGALEGDSGKQFLSPTHRLIKDRDCLLIDPRAEISNTEAIIIEEGTKRISNPINLSFEVKSRLGFNIPNADQIACLDNARLKYPLNLRRWAKGDSMRPLGMKGSKKLSDIFIDKKIPLNEKENIFILESAGEIAWVVGHKVDDRFKTTAATEEVCLIKLNNGE